MKKPDAKLLPGLCCLRPCRTSLLRYGRVGRGPPSHAPPAFLTCPSHTPVSLTNTRLLLTARQRSGSFCDRVAPERCKHCCPIQALLRRHNCAARKRPLHSRSLHNLVCPARTCDCMLPGLLAPALRSPRRPDILLPCVIPGTPPTLRGLHYTNLLVTLTLEAPCGAIPPLRRRPARDLRALASAKAPAPCQPAAILAGTPTERFCFAPCGALAVAPRRRPLQRHCLSHAVRCCDKRPCLPLVHRRLRCLATSVLASSGS